MSLNIFWKLFDFSFQNLEFRKRINSRTNYSRLSRLLKVQQISNFKGFLHSSNNLTASLAQGLESDPGLIFCLLNRGKDGIY